MVVSSSWWPTTPLCTPHTDEQDTRFYGKFAMIPTFEPSNQQEAYDMMAVAYDYSEKMHLPVLMRVTTRMAHSRAVVQYHGDAA